MPDDPGYEVFDSGVKEIAVPFEPTVDRLENFLYASKQEYGGVNELFVCVANRLKTDWAGRPHIVAGGFYRSLCYAICDYERERGPLNPTLLVDFIPLITLTLIASQSQRFTAEVVSYHNSTD